MTMARLSTLVGPSCGFSGLLFVRTTCLCSAVKDMDLRAGFVFLFIHPTIKEDTINVHQKQSHLLQLLHNK